MEFSIRKSTVEDYEAVVRIMNQVQQMHVEWRPDIYRPCDNIIPADIFPEIVEEGNFYVAETDGIVVGIMETRVRHMENPAYVTRNILFIESIAVDEKYREWESDICSWKN